MLLSFMTLYQPSVLEKWYILKTEDILHERIHWSPRLSRTNYPQTCLQYRHEGRAQRGACAGELVADEVTIEPNLDFRVSGILRAEVEQEEEQSRKHFARLVHAISITQTKMHQLLVKRGIKTIDSHSWKLRMPRIARNTSPKSMSLLLEVLGRVNRLL